MIDADVILSKTGIDVTQVQQGSKEWLRLRLGVITASEASCAISSPRSGNKWTDTKRSYFNKLIAEICTGQSPEVKARPLEWGKENEEVARRLFEFTTGLTVIDVPIIFKEEDMRVACSPDGDCSDGLGLELKCPFTSRDFINFRLNGFDGIKSEYMAQVQFSMWVTGKDAWHFANYDPRMKREGLHNVIIERDDKYISKFEESVPEFIERMDMALSEIGFTFGEQWN